MAGAYILGIESSCDETAAAVVRSGEQLASNVVFSQIAAHQPYGGVVPELASREHLKAIVPVVRKALADAGQTYQSIDALAVTQGPGLAGALLVGISYAKALAFALDKPLIAVNHLEGHIHAVLLEERQKDNREIKFPVLALVVSGGHTHLYLAEHLDLPEHLAEPRDLAEQQAASWSYKNIGHTRDDAAGEAFDKVAKLLGLGYPGGPIVDRLSTHGDPTGVKFPLSQLKHRDRKDKGGAGAEPRFDFSYSGIKTAVLRYVEIHNLQPSIEARRKALAAIEKPRFEDYLLHCDRKTLNLVASFQRAIVEDLAAKTLAAARACDVATLFVTGGVAANNELRQRFEQAAAMEGLPVYFPSRPLSTDNAAMIAAAAYPKFMAGDFAAENFSAEAALKL
jgi:tRNA N6-adenosine threonylcarbamoyltransferase